MLSSSDSYLSLLASLDPNRQREFLESLTDQELSYLKFAWRLNARQNQLLPPGDWSTWLILAGRGYGKTRTGAETVREWIDTGTRRIALVAATPADARDVMITGESGLLNIYPEAERPLYQPSLRRLTWPNGAVATIYSAHKHQDRSGMRGPQHEKAWGDEPAKWQYPGNLDQLMLGLRLGDKPQAVLTGTPRSIPMIRELLAESRKANPTVIVTVGSTFENRANLAASWFTRIINKYKGTRLGEQELYAKLLDEVQGALWTRAMLEASYLDEDSLDLEGRPIPEVRASMERVIVAIDPSVGDGKPQDITQDNHAETGIIVGGRRRGLGHLLEDGSLYAHPSKWAQRAVDLYRAWNADYIVAEKNNGGELVRLTINSVPGAKDIPVKLVTASRGKYTRAEPVALLHERRLIKHHGVFADLESQLTTWIPGEKSPDRLDAYVWTFSELLVDLIEFGIEGDSQHYQDVDDATENMSGERDSTHDALMVANGTGQKVDPAVQEMLRNGW